jgi:hypothetical protein
MPWLRAPEGLKLSADFAAGYQCMALNFNLPVYSDVARATIPIDLKLEDANSWIGNVRLNLDYNESWSFRLGLSGNATRNVQVFTRKSPAIPFFPTNPEPIEWTGSRLEWWSADGCVQYRTPYQFSLMAGLKRDSLTFGLRDPRVGDEAVNDAVWLIPGVLFVEQEDSGDMIMRSWIPYIGLSLESTNFLATFKWGPYSSTDVELPISENLLIIFGPDLVTQNSIFRYDVFDPGAMIEAEMEYFPKLPYNCDVSFWMKGQWYRIRSDGDLYFRFYEDDAGTITDISDQASGTSVLSRSIYSGGIRAGFSF